MTEPVDLYVAASKQKTEIQELFEFAKQSTISIEALKKENTDLKQRNASLEQALLQAVNERNEAIASSGNTSKDVEDTRKALEQAAALLQQLKDEVHSVLGEPTSSPEGSTAVVQPATEQATENHPTGKQSPTEGDQRQLPTEGNPPAALAPPSQ